MENKKPTIEIGIPALNEEANIGYLLESLLKQDIGSFDLKRIIVTSDGSTDRTVEIVQSFGGIIEVIDNKKREGIAVRQNQLFKEAKADVLILLDADIAINDKEFIKKLSEPIIKKKAELSSCLYKSIKPKTLIESALRTSLEIKNQVFKEYNKGDNMYVCSGVSRGFSKKLYSELRFIMDISEDMYGFLFVKKKGYKFKYVEDVFAYIKLPETISCHLMQSIRFSQAKEGLHDFFDKKMLDYELTLPKKLLFKYFFRQLLIHPIDCILFSFVYFYSKYRALKSDTIPKLWCVSKSSKKIISETKNSTKINLFFLLRHFIYSLILMLDKINFLSYPLVTVFCYHSVANNKYRFSSGLKKFKQQIDWLIDNFDSVDANDLENYLTGKTKIKRRSFVLAFDDGYRDNLELVNYLNSKGIRPIIFVLANATEVDRKELDNRLELLDNDEIKKLKNMGWLIGSHGMTHADFSVLSKGEIKKEVIESKGVLEKKLGFDIKYFAYPKGIYNTKIKKLVEQAGYKLAFSMDDKKIKPQSDFFSVARVGVDDTHTFNEFKALFSRPAVFIRGAIKNIINIVNNLIIALNKTNFSNILQKIKIFFVNRLVTVNKEHRLLLPDNIDNYLLVDTIDRPKGDNQYQFGVYQNKNGKKGILKMWDGEKKDGDWFWLDNEIKTYEGLDELFKLNGELIKEKFPHVKLPDFIKRIETNNSLGLFMEMLDGKDLNQEKTIQARTLKFEQTIKYFQYLGKLIAWSSLENRFVKRNNLHTFLIFMYMFLRASFMYPKLIPRFTLALFLFLFNFSSLLKANDMVFVHRDLTYTNVYSLTDGRIGVIDFEIAVLTNPMYEITQSVTSSWRLKGFWQEFYKLDIMKGIFKDTQKFKTYKTLTIFTGIHRLATSPKSQFESHYSYLMHGLRLNMKNESQFFKYIIGKGTGTQGGPVS